MKTIVYFLLTVFLLGCQEKEIVQRAEPKGHKEYTVTELYQKAYDIADLRALQNDSEFVARLSVTKRYGNLIIIEVDEIANGIHFCVKQPIEGLDHFREPDSSRSLAFNQLCYWFADKKAEAIKKSFLDYATGKTVRDRVCENCLDPEVWMVEVFNKGQYSSMTKDYLKGHDSVFVAMLMDRAKLNYKNNFRIEY